MRHTECITGSSGAALGGMGDVLAVALIAGVRTDLVALLGAVAVTDTTGALGRGVTAASAEGTSAPRAVVLSPHAVSAWTARTNTLHPSAASVRRTGHLWRVARPSNQPWARSGGSRKSSCARS